MKIYVFALLAVAAVAFALPAKDKDEDASLETLLVNEDNFLKLVGPHAATCTSSLCADLCRALGYPNSYCKDPVTCVCSR